MLTLNCNDTISICFWACNWSGSWGSSVRETWIVVLLGLRIGFFLVGNLDSSVGIILRMWWQCLFDKGVHGVGLSLDV